MLAIVGVGAQAASAQGPVITPFVGYNLPFTVNGEMDISVPGFGSASGTSEEEVGGGFAVGVNVMVPVAPLFLLVAEGAWNKTGDIEQTIRSGGSSSVEESDGATIWTAKAGIGFRLPTPFRTVLSAGPALIRVDPADVPDGGDFNDPYNNWALNLAASADFPLAPLISIRIGVEDYLIFWNNTEREDRIEDFFAEETGVNANVDIDTDRTNVFVLRAGIAIGL